MATNELSRTAINLDSAIRQLQNSLDLSERALRYGTAHSVAAELAGLAAGEVVTGTLSKERVQALAILAANIAYYLRGVTDGSGGTILGSAPLNAAALLDLQAQLGV